MVKKKFDPRVMRVCAGSINSLSVSLDYDDRPDRAYPMFLFAPDTRKFDHWHIKLDRRKARALRDWLNVYLED